MERVGRFIGKLKLPANAITPEDLARAAWPSAVGKKIASHTSAVALVRTCLVVEVEDAVWQKQLNTLRYQIIHNVRELVGPIVDDLELRPMIPKRRPQREEARPSAAPADESDAIVDPVLRHVYRISRKKASA